MNSEKINKIIFDTISTITNTDDFMFIVDEDDDIKYIKFRDNIVVEIEYAEEPAPWNFDKKIKYPQSMEVFQLYNPGLKQNNISYYHVFGSIDEETGGDKLVVVYGDGRTKAFRDIMDFSKHFISNFIVDIIHQWMPRHIVYRNYEESDSTCSKSMYFTNQRINVYEGKTTEKVLAGITIPVISERTFKIFHNSGFTYSMNRINYNIKDKITTEDDTVIFTVQYPMKMLDAATINKDRPAQENTYIFTPNDDGSILCEEIYSKRKGHNVSRYYSISIDEEGIISLIKYYSNGIGSELSKVRKITKTENGIKLVNIFDKDELSYYS